MCSHDHVVPVSIGDVRLGCCGCGFVFDDVVMWRDWDRVVVRGMPPRVARCVWPRGGGL